jgi:type I restriction enzyme S subunit
MKTSWQYPRYKPSGVEWIGDVPEHWESKKVTYGFSQIGSGTTPKSDSDHFYDGDVPWVTTSELRETVIAKTKESVTRSALAAYSALTLYPSGTLLFAMYGATIGRLGILGIPATLNQACCAFAEPTLFDTRFVFYWLWMRRPILISLSTGGGQPNLSQDDLRQIRISTPPLAEQRAIAWFLDRETGRMDQLVAKKLELIERLREKRTALISRTVTRGLPPAAARAAGLPENPPLKPSGVDWLGDIPEHWDVVAYKRVCTRVDVGIAEAATHAYCDDGVPIIRSTNVKPNKLDTSDVLRIEPWFAAKNRSKSLRAGDLVTVRTGYPGTTATVPSEFDGCQCFTLVLSTPKRTAHGPFFSWVLNSDYGASYFEMEGWGTAQTNISVPIVRFMPVPRPSFPEQVAIAAYLDAETAKLDALAGKVEEAVERLQEYRTALITAAVTGKIDVRLYDR